MARHKRHTDALGAPTIDPQEAPVEQHLAAAAQHYVGRHEALVCLGARRSPQVRREKAEARKMNALDWAAKLVEENGREIYESYLGAIKAGEWRAADSILDRIYGRPTERVEMKPEPKQIDEMGQAELWPSSSDCSPRSASQLGIVPKSEKRISRMRHKCMTTG
jgi:hypothetical protein